MMAKEMVNRTHIKTLLCELRPRLCTGNVFLQTALQLTKVDVSSNAGCIILSLAGDEWHGLVAITCPHQFSMNPSGLKIENDSLSFTVIIGPADKRDGSSSAQVLRFTQKENSPSSGSNFIPSSLPCVPKCRKCGSYIWENQVWKFERVLELPSTPLEEVIGEWFCHGHGKMVSWTPNPADCFHDQLSTVIYLKNSDPGVISCHKCHSCLGSVDKLSMCRLWGYTVQWEDINGSPWLNLPSSPHEAFLVAIRKTLLEEGTLKPIIKILVESRMSDGSENWLLLCVFNGDLKVLMPIDEGEQKRPDKGITLGNGESEDKLELEWMALLTEKNAQNDFSKVSQDLRNHLNDFTIKVPLCSKNMKRVLFKIVNDREGISDWENKAGIAVMKVTSPMYSAGIVFLEQWNQILPPKQRSCDGFSISYIKL